MNPTHTPHKQEHLSILQVLHRYENKWSFFGGLTYRNTPPKPETQIAHFRDLMNDLADLNRRAVVIDDPEKAKCRRRFGDRLHWFVRVETHPTAPTHMHFVLGGERLLNGEHRALTIPEVCQWIEDRWNPRVAEVVGYDQTKAGVEYITKIKFELNRDDSYYLSPALFKLFKNHGGAR